MGLEYYGLRYLTQCKRSGVSFAETLTLGRQSLMVSENGLRKRADALDLDIGVIPSLFREDGYADNWLRQLGARHLDILDFSDYEGATILHDMNLSIGEEFHNKYSCVLNGGTLEHVFNFPMAYENSLRMVAPGGHFISIAPCNNFPGHGFYQFSPDVFISTLVDVNGFKLEELIVMEAVAEDEWYIVDPPDNDAIRMEFRSCYPVYLMARARKIKEVPMGSLKVQQNFYEDYWASSRKNLKWNPDLTPLQAFRRRAKRKLSQWLFGHPFRHFYFHKYS